MAAKLQVKTNITDIYVNIYQTVAGSQYPVYTQLQPDANGEIAVTVPSGFNYQVRFDDYDDLYDFGTFVTSVFLSDGDVKTIEQYFELDYPVTLVITSNRTGTKLYVNDRYEGEAPVEVGGLKNNETHHIMAVYNNEVIEHDIAVSGRPAYSVEIEFPTSSVGSLNDDGACALNSTKCENKNLYECNGGNWRLLEFDSTQCGGAGGSSTSSSTPMSLDLTTMAILSTVVGMASVMVTKKKKKKKQRPAASDGTVR